MRLRYTLISATLLGAAALLAVPAMAQQKICGNILCPEGYKPGDPLPEGAVQAGGESDANSNSGSSNIGDADSNASSGGLPESDDRTTGKDADGDGAAGQNEPTDGSDGSGSSGSNADDSDAATEDDDS